MWPDKDSPFWPTLRVAMRSLIVLACLYLFYNKLDERDIKTMITVILADTGITAFSTIQSKKD